jgi:hypothetical protein
MFNREKEREGERERKSARNDVIPMSPFAELSQQPCPIKTKERNLDLALDIEERQYRKREAGRRRQTVLFLCGSLPPLYLLSSFPFRSVYSTLTRQR